MTANALVSGELQTDAFAVDDGFVVPGAQQDEVGKVGAAAFEPRDDVVGGRAGCGAGCRRVAAPLSVDRAEQVT